MAGHFPQSIGPSVFAMWNEFYNTEYAGDAALAPGPVASDRDEQTPTCRPGRGRRTGRTGLFRMVSTRRRSRGGRRPPYVGYNASLRYIRYNRKNGYPARHTPRPTTPAPPPPI